MLSNKNVGFVVTAIAVVAGLMIGVAGPGRAQDKAPDKDKPAAPVLNWKDTAEFNDADGANKETDPGKRLALLDKWKKEYPSTDPAILIIRQDMFLFAYTQLAQARQAFDEAQEILKDRPNLFPALIATVSQVMAIKPAPTAADMETAEKVANRMLDNPDSVFSEATRPANMTEAQWAQTKLDTKPYAEKILIAIYGARKDDKRAVDDLTKLIKRDPTLAVASYTLGQTMMRILGSEKRPQDQPPAFYQFARAIAYTGPGALAATDKTAIQTYLTKAYTGFHGSADGLNDLLAMAKNSPFPPANFAIKSTVDIAQDEETARLAEISKDPLMYLWVHGVKEKLASDGDAYFESNVKEFGLPPADDKTTPPTPQYFKAHIISMTPATKPKEILVGIEKPDVADAKLTFESALPGKMDAGEVIEFTGAAKDWSHDPKNVVVTFDVDPKEGLHGTWTGKNTPGATKTGTAASKTGAASKGTKAAPKQ